MTQLEMSQGREGGGKRERERVAEFMLAGESEGGIDSVGDVMRE